MSPLLPPLLLLGMTAHVPTTRDLGPCCKVCESPQAKYLSVDTHGGFCGEACIRPSHYKLFKLFEHNLTAATAPAPCSLEWTPDGRHYSAYNSTVTHGLPGLLSITLDLYGPGATSTAASGEQSH